MGFKAVGEQLGKLLQHHEFPSLNDSDVDKLMDLTVLDNLDNFLCSINVHILHTVHILYICTYNICSIYITSSLFSGSRLNLADFTTTKEILFIRTGF